MFDLDKAIELLRKAGYVVEYQEEHKYYNIIGAYIHEPIGKTTSNGRLDVLSEEPDAEFEEISEEEYYKEED